jgi:hypothetical protein
LRQKAPQLFEDRKQPAVIVHGRGRRQQHEQEH